MDTDQNAGFRVEDWRAAAARQRSICVDKIGLHLIRDGRWSDAARESAAQWIRAHGAEQVTDRYRDLGTALKIAHEDDRAMLLVGLEHRLVVK